MGMRGEPSMNESRPMRVAVHIATLFFFLFFGVGCGDSSLSPARDGQAGSACTATNDCASPLVCILGSCMLEDHPIAPSARECVPAPTCLSDAECVDFLENCVAGTCTRHCRSDADCYGSFTCDVALGSCHYRCASDDTCSILSQFYCDPSLGTAGGCRECGDDSHCSRGDICSAHQCVEGCEDDAECGALEVCDPVSRTCEWAGCGTDRECVLWTGNPDYVCDPGDRACKIRCEHDVECVDSPDFAFEQCVSGTCTYAGCSSDSACRALHGAGHVCGASP